MTNHPKLTPPPEMVQRWLEELYGGPVSVISPFDQRVLIAAAQWGADQELEACCELLTKDWGSGHGERLRRFRRPKPPSLKEQALQGLTRIESTNDFFSNQMKDLATIRRALEQLDD